jgi:hypothetical protein
MGDISFTANVLRLMGTRLAGHLRLVGRELLLDGLGLGGDLTDVSDHVEGALGLVVVLASKDLLCT